MKKDTFQSRNFWVTIISLFFGLLTANNLNIGLTPEELVNDISGHNTVEIFTFLAINFFQPVSKLIAKIKAGEWSWDFLKSANFRTQALSVIAVGLAFWLDEVTIGFVVAIIANIANLVYHYFEQKNEVKPVE